MIFIPITNLFEHVFLLSLMGSIPAIGILLLKGILKDKLSAGLQYYIWLLMIFRLLIPFTIESPYSLFHFMPAYEKAVSQQQQHISPAGKADTALPHNNTVTPAGAPGLNAGNDLQTDSPKHSSFNINTIASLWLAGTITIYLYIILVNTAFLIKLNKCLPCSDREVINALNHCKERLHITRNVTIIYNDRLTSPMVWGVLRPRILIPREMLQHLSEEELNFILLHELAHIKRKDLAMNLIGIFLQGLYWFNPIIWYSMHKMKQDCEISCDASVLRVLIEEEYKQYGLTILSIMKKMNEIHLVPGTAGFASKQNKRRIIMITKYKKTSVKWAVLTLLCLALLTGCASLTGSNKNTAANNTNKSAGNSTTGNSTAGNNTNNSQNTKDQDTKDQDAKGQDTKTPDTADNTKNGEAAPDATATPISEAVSFQQYFNMLGSSKEDLIKNLKEEPSTIDEGGLEFKNNGLRVWFDTANDASTVSQIFTDRTDIDFNGAIIGDKIDSFKNALGEPVSDKNGDMHFKYQEGFISVNYDTKTKEAVAVYLLSKDF